MRNNSQTLSYSHQFYLGVVQWLPDPDRMQQTSVSSAMNLTYFIPKLRHPQLDLGIFKGTKTLVREALPEGLHSISACVQAVTATLQSKSDDCYRVSISFLCIHMFACSEYDSLTVLKCLMQPFIQRVNIQKFKPVVHPGIKSVRYKHETKLLYNTLYSANVSETSVTYLLC